MLTKTTPTVPAWPLTVQDFKQASEWPTVQEVADAYGLRARWLHDMIAARKFRAVRLNVLRIDPDDFHRFLNDLNRAYTEAGDAEDG